MVSVFSDYVAPVFWLAGILLAVAVVIAILSVLAQSCNTAIAKLKQPFVEAKANRIKAKREWEESKKREKERQGIRRTKREHWLGLTGLEFESEFASLLENSGVSAKVTRSPPHARGWSSSRPRQPGPPNTSRSNWPRWPWHGDGLQRFSTGLRG